MRNTEKEIKDLQKEIELLEEKMSGMEMGTNRYQKYEQKIEDLKMEIDTLTYL